MTAKPVFEKGWGPALEGEEWKAFKKKELEHLTYHQKFLDIYCSLNKDEISPEINNLINAAFGTIDTAEELLSHMSYVRDQREKDKEKSTKGIRKGGEFSQWKPYEQVILKFIGEYESEENRLKYKSDTTKITQKHTRNNIEREIGLVVTESTFNGWLKKYRENNGKIFS